MILNFNWIRNESFSWLHVYQVLWALEKKPIFLKFTFDSQEHFSNIFQQIHWKKSCYFISLEQKLQSNVQLNSLRHQEIRGHSKKKSFITESSWKTEFFCTVFRSPKCDPLQGQKKLTIISNLVVISLATRIQTIQKFFHPMGKSGMYWITKKCKKMLIQVVKHWRKSPKHG